MTRWLAVFLLLVFSRPVQADEIAVGDRLRGAPAVAAGVDQFLVAWTDGTHLQARRFDLSGPVDAQPVVLAEVSDAWIAVAFDGVDYLIVWGDTTGAHARFLSSGETLTLLEEPSTHPHAVAVAWNGVDFLAAWGSATSVHAALLRSGESVVQAARIAGGLVRVTAVTVATGADRDLILYAAYADPGVNDWPSSSILDGQVVDRNLTGLATTRLDRLPNAMGCMGQRALGEPRAIWTGGDWRVTWIQASCFLGHSDVDGRVSRNGSLSSMRVRTPFRQGVIRSHLLLMGGEPALVTQFLDRGTPREPVFLHLFARSVAPREVLPRVRAYAAATAGGNRLVLAFSSGEGVAAKVETIELPPRMRRRSVR